MATDENVAPKISEHVHCMMRYFVWISIFSHYFALLVTTSMYFLVTTFTLVYFQSVLLHAFSQYFCIISHYFHKVVTTFTSCIISHYFRKIVTTFTWGRMQGFL